MGLRRNLNTRSYYGNITARSVKCVYGTLLTCRIRGYRLKFRGGVKLRLFFLRPCIYTGLLHFDIIFVNTFLCLTWREFLATVTRGILPAEVQCALNVILGYDVFMSLIKHIQHL